MVKRKIASYHRVFDYINKSIFEMEPECFVTDFEIALRTTLREMFPTASLLGCWFHYCQCLRRKVSSKFKPLRGFIKTSVEGKTEFRKIMSLPLIPAQDIKATYEMIKCSISQLSGASKFHKFLLYFEKQWLTKVSTFLKTIKYTYICPVNNSPSLRIL